MYDFVASSACCIDGPLSYTHTSIHLVLSTGLVILGNSQPAQIIVVDPVSAEVLSRGSLQHHPSAQLRALTAINSTHVVGGFDDGTIVLLNRHNFEVSAGFFPTLVSLSSSDFGLQKMNFVAE